MGWCRGLGMCLCAFSLLVVLLGSWLAMRLPELEALLEEMDHVSEEEPFDWDEYNFGDREESGPKSPLELACESGDLDAVREAVLFADQNDLNAALCGSCKRNNTAVVQVLLEQPHVDVNTAPKGDTPLFLAALYNEPDVIKLLLDHGADPSIRSKDDTTGLSKYTPASLSPLHGLGRRANLGNHPDRDERLNRGASLLLDAGADANAVDRWGSTPLHGCLHSRARYVKLLLDRGADPNAQNHDGGTPMHSFFNLEEQPEDLELLMARGARLDIVRTSDGLTPLHVYVRNLNNLTALRPYVSDWSVADADGNTLLHQAVASHRVGKKALPELLELGLDPNLRNNEGCQAIHMICSSAVLQEVLDMLLPAGADLEARDYQGRTLLARLMSGYPHHDYHQLLPALISIGANLNTQDHSGNGVLSYTIRPHLWHSDHFSYLLSIGADPHITNNNGDTLLHLLAAKFATVAEDTVLTAMIKLIEMGVSPTQTNHQGRTPLHMLCIQTSQHIFAPSIFGAKASIDLILEAGLVGSLNKPDNDGVLPIHLAATVSEALVGKLISRGADTTAATKDGRNLLHIAATARQSNVVGLLLEHYRTIDKLALVNGRCNKRRTPLHEASRSGRLETVNLLLEAGADVNVVDKDDKGPLDACSAFTFEQPRWPICEDKLNTFDTYSAAGVLGDDEARPKPENCGTRRVRQVGYDGITSEHDTANIRPIIRALVDHGADLKAGRFSLNAMSRAQFDGSEDMVVELAKISEEKGIDLTPPLDFDLNYINAKSGRLAIFLDKQFPKYVVSKDVLQLVLDGHQEEVAQALERNIDELRNKSMMIDNVLEDVLLNLARYGYSELFARLGDLMAEVGWINKCQGVFSGEAGQIPYLLSAAQRPLPNLETIKVIVEKFGADVNHRFPEGAKVIPDVRFSSVVYANRQYQPGDTALHYLAQGGHWWHKEAIKYLLQHGADPNARNNAGKTPLALAVQEQQYGGYLQKEITRILLEGGADPNIPASCGHTPLALAGHSTELVKLLLEYGARPSAEDPEELFSALDNYNLDVVKLLLATGLDPNSIILTDAQPHWHLQRFPKPEDASGVTVRPLEYISLRPFNEAHARDRAIELIKYLLDQGADPHLSSSVNRSSILHYVFADGGVIQPYMEMDNLDLERRDPDGRTLLIAAAMCGVGTNSYAFDVSLLPSTDRRLTPVPYAKGDPTRAMTLYERGADLTATDNMGNNVIHLLVEHECKDRHGRADLHCETEYRRTLSLFLEKAPQLATQKNRGWLWRTPLAKARAMKNEWAVDVLTKFLESA